MGRGLFKVWRELAILSVIFCTCTNLYAGCGDLLGQLSPDEITAARRVREFQEKASENISKGGITAHALSDGAEAIVFNRLYQDLKEAHPKIMPEDLRAVLQTFTPKKDNEKEDIKVTTEREVRELEKARESFRPIFEEAAGKDKNVILDAKPESFEFVEILNEKEVTVELGSPESEVGRGLNEPLRTVTLFGPLEMQRTPSTHEQWVSLIQTENPSYFKKENQVKLLGIDISHGYPVEQVSWDDVQEFIKKLSDRDNQYKYALASDAVWEYAARAGTRTSRYFGDDESMLEQHAWFNKNSGNKTHQVATKLPNPFGLFDMYGNVWEWGQDNYTATPSGGTNPLFDYGDSVRVVRGGSWGINARLLRSANRFGFSADDRFNGVGFRLVRTPK